jgi:shikimate dehydrogenase
MTRCAVIGHPVAHSLSPLIHSYWMEKYGIAGSYERIDIAPENLESGVRDLAARGYAGFNVTLPHKQEIMKFCASLDPAARAAGAVNCVSVRDGLLRGRNTDIYGFTENLRRGAPVFGFKKSPALVLGAGGGARAAAQGLRALGAGEIFVAGRTPDRAAALGETAVAWEERHKIAEKCRILVNTTPLGMTGQGALDFDAAALPDGALVCDIVYKPLMTKLLEDAARRGLTAVTGIGMLLHQAVPAFGDWFGVKPEVTTELQDQIAKAAR